MREPVPHHLGWTALSTALQPACLRQKQPEPSADGSKARSNKLAADSPLERTGFEPSVPLGGIGAPTQPGFAFGRRLGRLHGACALDRWAKGAGGLVIEGRRFHCYALRGKTEPQAAAHERCSL